LRSAISKQQQTIQYKTEKQSQVKISYIAKKVLKSQPEQGFDKATIKTKLKDLLIIVIGFRL
jgi:hypothetical protein